MSIFYLLESNFSLTMTRTRYVFFYNELCCMFTVIVYRRSASSSRDVSDIRSEYVHANGHFVQQYTHGLLKFRVQVFGS